MGNEGPVIYMMLCSWLQPSIWETKSGNSNGRKKYTKSLDQYRDSLNMDCKKENNNKKEVSLQQVCIIIRRGIEGSSTIWLSPWQQKQVSVTVNFVAIVLIGKKLQSCYKIKHCKWTFSYQFTNIKYISNQWMLNILSYCISGFNFTGKKS